MTKMKNMKKYSYGSYENDLAFPASNIRYFYIEKKRQELHKLINYYGGISNSREIYEMSKKFDDVLLIEYYQK